MKTVLFVPGFQETISSRHYQAVLGVMEAQSYSVRFVPIHWRRTTIRDWVQELYEVYCQYDPENVILAGFSYGAMTALVVASKRVPSAIWCFSLSPYFAEDLRSTRMKLSWLKAIGIRRTKAFASLRFSDLAEKMSCDMLVVVGGNEHTIVKERAHAAHRLVAGSRLTVIPGVGHDVGNALYVAGIAEALTNKK